MLVTLEEILKDAESKKYGVGLFNMLNLEMARGIIEAAEEEKSPLILGVAEVHLPFIPFTYAKEIMAKIARESSVPVCLHFDHGTDYSKILEAIRGGFSSVMFDGSSLSFEENTKKTREIVKVAHALGVSVEAELGHVGGAEDSSNEAYSIEDDYTKVSEVTRFIEETNVDALAVAVGTAHGKYIKPPVLDLNRLKEIYDISTKPLVLHGGSGLSDNDFRGSIECGIRKINICTEMCLAAHQSYTNSHNQKISFENSLTLAKDSVKNIVKGKMQLFGSSNKA